MTEHKIYYCSECKKISTHLDDVVFVDKPRYRPFCSEKCIITFFTPMINFLEEEEENKRKELKVDEKFKLEKELYAKIVELNFSGPDEIWYSGDDLAEDLFVFIKYHADIQAYAIVMTLLFDGEPSFILLETMTTSEELVAFYRRGVRYQPGDVKENDPGMEQLRKASEENIPMTSEEMAYLEDKRSELLAKLIEQRAKTDIPFEQFTEYEKFIEETLNAPDDVYLQELGNGDTHYVYCRGFEHFFYIIICTAFEMNELQMEGTLIPILAFPTNDPELLRLYRTGKKIEGQSML